MRALHRAWLVAGVVGEFGRPGDYRARQVADVPVVVARDDDGFHVLRNACPHQGMPILRRNEAGHSRRLVCPLHGWTFALDGRHQLDRVSRRLSAVPDPRWHIESLAVSVESGIVWARVDADADPSGSPAPADPPFGRPEVPRRVLLRQSWRSVIAELERLPGVRPLPPTSVIWRPAGGDTRLLATVVPRSPERTEVVAWAERRDEQ